MTFKYIQPSDTVRTLANKFNDNFNELAALNLSNLSGENGQSGLSGISGISGQLGGIGLSGRSGISGISGLIGPNGNQGISGLQGNSGRSGMSGISTSGLSGRSGLSGTSGLLGEIGLSGGSGISGLQGISGDSNGQSGLSGRSGLSGIEGLNPALSIKYIGENTDEPGNNSFGWDTEDVFNINKLYFSKNSLQFTDPIPGQIMQFYTINSKLRVSKFGDESQFVIFNLSSILTDIGDYFTLNVSTESSTIIDMTDFEGEIAVLTINMKGDVGNQGLSGISGRAGLTGGSGISGNSGRSGISGLSSSGLSGISGVDGGKLLFGSSIGIVLTGTTTNLTAAQLNSSVINIIKTNTGNHTVNLPSTSFIPFQLIKIFLRNGNTGTLTLTGTNNTYAPGIQVASNSNTTVFETKMIGFIHDSSGAIWVLQDFVDNPWQVPNSF